MAKGKKCRRPTVDNQFDYDCVSVPNSPANQVEARIAAVQAYDSAVVAPRYYTPYNLEERCCSPSSCADEEIPSPVESDRDSLVVINRTPPSTYEESLHTLNSESITLSPSNSNQKFRQLTCSDRFWFEDGSVVIKVEDTLYNVHKSLLKSQSVFFREKLSLRYNFATILGSRQRPHIIDVEKSDFDLLLDFIYPVQVQLIVSKNKIWRSNTLSRKCGSKLDHTTKEWLSILAVSTKLNFTSIRTAAINTLSEVIGLAERIRLGRERSVSEWFPECYRQLCKREEPLSLEEGKELGLEDVIKVARAREMLSKGVPWPELEKSFAI
ncbi:hypothetical protein EW145_g1869 [Phellinidium pouzarii]|uniref:BTB domain-containing protein n=1 Tax=Phellinidium pouzarii TaxID=167371 RepID=A0A4S4LCU2_9AGAM|nr:hypothetical protein EW145_g1869 [Phellinidium pouzarii]